MTATREHLLGATPSAREEEQADDVTADPS